MKSKAPLMLMEQMVMLLVFALAAAVCLQAFVKADELSKQIGIRDRAVLLCQNMAEQIKESSETNRNPVSAVASRIETTHREPDTFGVEYNADWQLLSEGEEAAYRLSVTTLDSGVDGLGQAQIMVTDNGRSPEPLFSVVVSWQEVIAYG